MKKPILKGEYLISQRIGIGLHVNYANTSVKGRVLDDDAFGNSRYYDYKASIPRLRIMPTLNIHMGNSNWFDPYFSFGAGYSSMKIKEETEAPSVSEIDLNLNASFAGRAEFGMRFFFTDNVGASFNVGIGAGALLGFGLAAKL